MKKLIAISLYIILLGACSDSSGVEDVATPKPPANNAPSVPSLLVPSNTLPCTDNPLDFSWNTSSDPDGDSVSYHIQVATNNSFSKDLQVLTTTSTKANFTLKKGVPYYWRVSAKDTKNKSSVYSTTWTFYSEGEGVSNHLPYAATLVSPELNANITEDATSLKWSSSDVDNDPLVYDIYVGNVNPPPLVLENSSSTNFDMTLDNDLTYFWQIIVKDDAGGESIGQIWSFQTN